MKKTTFIESGRFYKGNLHAHTTESDGRLEPSELISAYKAEGYDFLLISDHNVYSHYTEYDTAEFIMLPGFEGDVKMPRGDTRVYHFILLRDPARLDIKPAYSHLERIERLNVKDLSDVQRYIDDMRERGFIVMINHPYWSRIEYDDILPLKGLFAVEIYNHCSGILENVGESDVCFDALWRKGLPLWCAAVDDCHSAEPGSQRLLDSFGGFVCVKAPSLSEKDINESLLKGSFYASQGPEIRDFYVEDGYAVVECSPVSRIYVNGDLRTARHLVSTGEPLHGARFKLDGSERYVRAEIYDENGLKAWANPIALV